MARSAAKRFFGTLLFVVALVVTVGAGFTLYANSVNDTRLQLSTTENIPPTMLVAAIVLGVIVLLLFIILLIRGYDRGASELDEREAFFIPENAPAGPAREAEDGIEEPKGFGQGPEVVVYNLPTVPEMYKPWEKVPKRRKAPFTYSFYFPRQVDSAIYVNNYVPIDAAGNMLKLRTLLAGPKDAQKKELAREHQFPKKAPAPKPAAAPAPEPVAAQATIHEPEATPSDSPYKAKPIVVGAGDGREFITELEERIKARDAQRTESHRAAAPRPSDAFYDYAGDVHDVEDVEGIGKTFANKLRQVGVETTARLTYEDSRVLGEAIGVPVKTVELWKSMAELMKVSGIGKQYAEALARAGVGGIADLKKRSADAIASDVNTYLESLKTNVLGTKITAKRVEGWQKAAKDMRRVRMKVPER